MMQRILLEATVALLPVLAFLGVLRHLDAHRLVPPKTVLATLVAGGVLAVFAYFVNDLALGVLGLDLGTYTRWVSPVIEETLKAGVLIYLFSRNHVGFMVDAAIIGFAIGAGFAVFENLYYLHLLTDANLGTWIVRGFGTAIMHGGATAVFGVLAQSLTERHARSHPELYLPGLAVAIALHAIFNRFPGSPLLATLATLIVFPGTLMLVFAKSEHAIHDWLVHDFESHEHLLQAIRTGEFTHGEAGRFMTDLAQRFNAAHLADMYAYIRLHTQLVLRAEKLLLAREAGGIDARLQQDDRRDFAELHALERRIGRTALLALWPHLHFSRQELWELYELENEAYPAHHAHGGHHRFIRLCARVRRLRRRFQPALSGSHRMTLVLHRWLREKMQREA